MPEVTENKYNNKRLTAEELKLQHAEDREALGLTLFNPDTHGKIWRSKLKTVYSKKYPVYAYRSSKRQFTLGGEIHLAPSPDHVAILKPTKEVQFLESKYIAFSYNNTDGTPVTLDQIGVDTKCKLICTRFKFSSLLAMRIPKGVNFAFIDYNGDEHYAFSGDFVTFPADVRGGPLYNEVTVYKDEKAFRMLFSTTDPSTETTKVRGNTSTPTVKKPEGITEKDPQKILLAKARNPNLSIPVYFQGEQFNPRLPDNKKSLAGLNDYYLAGGLKISFKCELPSTGNTFTLEFSERLNKKGTEIAYCLGNKPVIIKSIDTKYKSIRGLLGGLFSASLYNEVLEYNGHQGLLSEVYIGHLGIPVYFAHLCQHPN